MSNKDSTDELFDLKTAYYLGNYQQAINEAQKLKLNDPRLQLEKDVYMYRAFIAQKKFRVVLDDIHQSAADELKYVRLIAEFLSNESRRFDFFSRFKMRMAYIKAFFGPIGRFEKVSLIHGGL